MCAGTRIGGLKSSKKVLAKDPNFFRNIGHEGGIKGTTGGFASDKVGADGLTGFERARVVGAKGGRISKRPSKKVKEMTNV